MNCKTVARILSEASYVRTSCSEEELRCAEYLRAECRRMGFETRLESFPLKKYTEHTAKLIADGREIACKSYYGSACGTLEGELYYLTGTDPVSLKKCKDKIVLSDKPVGYLLYDQLAAHGAKGFIVYNGNLYVPNHDIDRKEVRYNVERRLSAVSIHVSDAVELVRQNPKRVSITVEQSVEEADSHNVILDLPGESDETVILSAHYDSTPFSKGSYDNLSGCIGLLYLAEYFATRPHRRSLRFLWCGSEERGLLGSLAYCRDHRNDELQHTVFNINLDMLGSLMGEFVVFSCVNEDMTEFLKKFASKHRFSATVRHDIRSSDSNSFLHFDIPAVSFARYAPSNTALIHTRYDTLEVMSVKRLLDDMRMVRTFTDFIVNEPQFPVSLAISEHIQKKIEDYMKHNLYANKEAKT